VIPNDWLNLKRKFNITFVVNFQNNEANFDDLAYSRCKQTHFRDLATYKTPIGT